MNIEDLLKIAKDQGTIRWRWSSDPDPDHERTSTLIYLPYPGIKARNTFLDKECVIVAVALEGGDCVISAPWARQCYAVDDEFYFSWSYAHDLEAV
jgi:hypothetical protein